jgi:hypothetical protein
LCRQLLRGKGTKTNDYCRGQLQMFVFEKETV